MTARLKPEAVTFGHKLVKIEEFTSAMKAIEYAHMCQSLEPRGLLLVGESGNGKTALIEDYLSACEVEETDELSPKRVIHVTATSNISIHDFAARMLRELGDPDPFLGTFANKEERIWRYKEELGLELVFIDEFHDLLPKHKYDQRSPVVKFVKWLMSTLGVSIVMAGLPLSTEILDIDEQIETRCNEVVEVHPFSMVDSEKRLHYATFVKNLLKVYPYPLPGLLSKDTHGLMRLLLATHGNKRRLKDLFVHAIQITPEGASTTFEVLHEAWHRTVTPKTREMSKSCPFKSPIKSVKADLVELKLL